MSSCWHCEPSSTPRPARVGSATTSIAALLVFPKCPACVPLYATVFAILGVDTDVASRITTALLTGFLFGALWSWRAAGKLVLALGVAGGSAVVVGRIEGLHALKWVGVAIFGCVALSQIIVSRSRRKERGANPRGRERRSASDYHNATEGSA